MKIYMLDEVLQFTNRSDEIENIIHKINHIAQESNVIIQQITVDGADLEEDFYEHLSEHIAQVEEVRVETVSEREFVDQLIVTSMEYLGRAIPELDAFTNRLYQGLNDEVWGTFHSFIEGLEYIIFTIERIRTARNAYVSFSDASKFHQQLHTNLQQLMSAAEDKDNSLMSDLINYEFKPQLSELLRVLGETIDREVKRHDLQ